MKHLFLVFLKSVINIKTQFGWKIQLVLFFFFWLNRWTFQTFMRITVTTTLKTTKNVIKLNNSRFGLLTIPPMKMVVERMMMNGMRIAWGFIAICILLSLFVVWIHTQNVHCTRSTDADDDDLQRQHKKKRAGEAKIIYTHTHATTSNFFYHFFHSTFDISCNIEFVSILLLTFHMRAIFVMRLQAISIISILFCFELNWIKAMLIQFNEHCLLKCILNDCFNA